MRAVVFSDVWRSRDWSESSPWIPRGTYPVKRRFDDNRYLIEIGSGLTLVRSDECRIITEEA